ncbi:MAG: hypothetical protein IJZ39_02665 [Oscillospiraceae bacterium]|nr:hypothetical protein [Oscillospiraceae bacterium]
MTVPPETIAQATEALAETVPQVTETVTEAIETVTEAVPDYIPYLQALVEYENYQTAFLLFIVVVILCYFGYKFLRIFF